MLEDLKHHFNDVGYKSRKPLAVKALLYLLSDVFTLRMGLLQEGHMLCEGNSFLAVR